MKMSKALRARNEESKKTDRYWVESAKLDFALDLERERRRLEKSYSQVADGIHTSPAYISKVFRGDANLTIESMVKLARSLDCRLEISIRNENVATTVQHIKAIEMQKHSRAQEKQDWMETIASMMKEDDGIISGRFNLPQERFTSCNDQDYLDVA